MKEYDIIWIIIWEWIHNFFTNYLHSIQQSLIEHMIQKDPESRHSVAEYLEQERGTTFPQHFYTFLWPFLKQFAVTPIMPDDDRIKQWVWNKSSYEMLMFFSASFSFFAINVITFRCVNFNVCLECFYLYIRAVYIDIFFFTFFLSLQNKE